MTLIDDRTSTARVTREELVQARAVLDGLPVLGPITSAASAARYRQHDPVAGAVVELAGVLEGGRDRLARLAALLDAAATRGAVLR